MWKDLKNNELNGDNLDRFLKRIVIKKIIGKKKN